MICETVINEKETPNKEESKPTVEIRKASKKRKKSKPFEPRVRLRYEILIEYRDNPKITLRELKGILGLSSLQSVHDHIKRLRKEGLLQEVKRGTSPLTVAGLIVIKYVEESTKGECLFNVYAKRSFGKTSRQLTQVVNEVIADLDKNYADIRNGATYWDGIKGKYVLERKVSAQEVIKAARQFPSIWMAASATGLVRKSYEERLQKLFGLFEKKMKGE